MDLNIISRLEALVDQLLDRNRDLEAENASLREERQRFRTELDRVLEKLEHLDQGAS